MVEVAGIDDSLSKLDQREQELAKLLKEGSRDELERDAGILKEMGEVYCERGLLTKDVDNFVKSSALINAALLRTQRPGLVGELERQLKHTELAFCKVLSITSGKTPLDFSSDVKSRLSVIRNTIGDRVAHLLKEIVSNYSLDVSDSVRVSAEREFIEKSRLIFGQLSADMVQIVQYLLSESENILGTPPQEYAVMGLGSLARGDTTPFSDIEWAILVEDESKDIGYFRNLARLVHLFVLNIQETLLKSLAIKSLNDYDTPGGNWFIDSVAPRGFQFDSAAPYACNTPLGRPDRPTKEGRELIRTPQRMAQLCEYNTALKEGYNIDRIMTSVIKIGGSAGADNLVDEFTSIRARVKTNSNIITKAFTEILDSFREFMPKLNFHKPSKTVRDIKKSMFRLPTLIVTLFKSCFFLSANTSWEVLEEMVFRNLLSSEAAHNLKCVVSIASLLRLATYSKKMCQDELISLLPQKHASGGSIHSDVIAHLDNFTVLVIRFYFTMQPFSSFIFHPDESVDWAADRRCPVNSFYDDSGFWRGVIELNGCLYGEARDSFFKHIEKWNTNLNENSKNIKAVVYKNKTILYDNTDAEVQEGFNLIGRTFKSEGNFDLATKYASLAFNMCETTHCALSKKVEYVNQMAMSHSKGKNINYDLALQLSFQALDIERDLHADRDALRTAVMLDNIGCIYLKINDFENAIKYSKSSLDMLKRLFGEDDHHETAQTTSNLGNFYCVQGNFDEGMRYLEKSRDMMLKVHGSGTHPNAALNLEHLGNAHFMVDNFSDALQCFSEALAIRKQLHGANGHPRTAFCLYCLWPLKIFEQKYDEAMIFLEEAVTMKHEVFSETNSLHHFLIYFNRGIRWLSQIQNDEKRRHYLKESLRISQRLLGDQWKTAFSLLFVAKSLRDSGKLYEALEYFEKSVSIEKRLSHVGPHSSAGANDGGNSFKELLFEFSSDVLHNIGSLYYKQGYHDSRSALDFFTRVLKVLKDIHKNGDHSEIVFCLDSISALHVQMGDYDKSLEYCMDSLRMKKKLHGDNDCSETAASLHSLAQVYLDMFQPREALKYCELSLGMFERLHISTDGVLNTLGLVYTDLGNLKLALQHLLQSLAENKKVPNNNEGLRSTILTNIGDIYRRMEDYGQALEFHTESLSLKRKIFNHEDHKGIADSLSLIEIAKRCSGEVDEALKYQVDSLNMRRRLYGHVDHFEIAISLGNIGNVYCDKGELEIALDYQFRGLDMKKRVYAADHLEIVISMNGIMHTYMAKKEWDTALQYGNSALDMVNRLQKGVLSPNSAQYLLQIGMVYAQKRNTKKALEHLENSLAQARIIYGSRDHQVIGKSLNNIGAVHFMVKEYQKACDFLKKSLEMKRRLFGSVNDRRIAVTLNNFGMVYYKMGKLNEALQYHRDAFNMRCKIYGIKTHPECIRSLNRCTRVCKSINKQS